MQAHLTGTWTSDATEVFLMEDLDWALIDCCAIWLVRVVSGMWLLSLDGMGAAIASTWLWGGYLYVIDFA